MYVLKIKTIGEISLGNKTDRAVGYRYDVPFDSLEIPYLPMRRILNEAGCCTDGVRIGLAHPDGYEGLITSAVKLLHDMPNCARFIRSHFTDERFIKEKGYSIRCLKAGLTLFAGITFNEEKQDKLVKMISSVKHIGVVDDGITGEVEITLQDISTFPDRYLNMPTKCRYSSLDYSVMLLTPACFHSPYADEVKTYTYIPGEVIKKELSRYIGIDTDRIVCSNAYISNGIMRLLPTPICVSVVKLDKEQLRYRLAPGKDPRIAEQDIVLPGTYTEGVQEHFVRYTSPMTEHIVAGDENVYDALSAGQIFSGTIYGTDEEVRAIADFINSSSLTHFGDLSEDGFGSAYRKVDRLNEAEIQSEVRASCFDVCCVSDALIINDMGMPSCRAEDLLGEIEYKLGVFGRLKIVGKYISVCQDSRKNYEWGVERANARCFAAGSVLRLETVDESLDISEILHCFIGERNGIGYGEIVAYPAKGQYYRLAEKTAPVRYVLPYQESGRALKMGSNLTDTVITAMVRSRIRGLAITDRQEYAKGHSVQELIPTDLLLMLKERYDPTLSEETMYRWYEEALMEDEDDKKLY